MRLKSAAVLIIGSLMLAGGFSCLADEATTIEKPLSYNGQVALASAKEFIQLKKYKEALKQADNAIKTDPKSGMPYMVKAYIHDKQGDVKKANSFFAKAIALSPNNGYIRSSYGVHLCEQKQYKDADLNFQLAISDRGYPLTAQAYEKAAQCAYQNQDMALAEDRARSALAINDTSVNALFTMIQVRMIQKRFFEARAFFQRIEALGPLSAQLLELAQQIEKSAGDDRAAARYKKQLDTMLQAQIQPPTGEGQKKP